jgi:hypothetical protein
MRCQALVSASRILQRKEKGSDWDLPQPRDLILKN